MKVKFRLTFDETERWLAVSAFTEFRNIIIRQTGDSSLEMDEILQQLIKAKNRKGVCAVTLNVRQKTILVNGISRYLKEKSTSDQPMTDTKALLNKIIDTPATCTQRRMMCGEAAR